MPTRNYNSVPVRPVRQSRRARLIGDSMTGRGNYSVTLTAAQAVAGTMTFTANTHALYNGAGDAYCAGFSDDNYNGLKLDTTRVDANNFSIACPLNVANSPTLLTNCAMINQHRISDRNWFAIANYINGAPFFDILNFGYSGDDTKGIRDRFIKHVLPQCQDGDLVQLQGGINNFQNQVAADIPDIVNNTMNDFIFMTEECLKRNLIPLFTNITPLDSNLGGAWNATAAVGVMNVNMMMQDLYETIYQDGIYFDLNRCVVDFVNTNGNFLSTMRHSDFIHINALGAQRGAALLATQLAAFRYVRKSRARTLGHTTTLHATSKQIWTNPVNNGANGGAQLAVAGAGSGTNTGNFVPDGETITLTRSTTGSNVVSRAARADGIGYNTICTFNPAAANDAIDIVGGNFASGAIADKKYHAEIELSITGVGSIISKIEFGWENFDGTTYTGPQALYAAGTGQLQDGLTTWVLRTPRPFKMSSAMTSLKWRLKVTASGAGGPVVITHSQPTFTEVTE